MKKIIIFVLIVFLSATVYAYQFEDYEWGMTEQEITTIISDFSEYTMAYKTDLMGQEATVRFFFTNQYKPKSLYKVGVSWENYGSDLREPVQELLVNKYGTPQKGTPYSSGSIPLTWVDPENGDTIQLTEARFLTITYTSKKYSDLDKQALGGNSK